MVDGELGFFVEWDFDGVGSKEWGGMGRRGKGEGCHEVGSQVRRGCGDTRLHAGGCARGVGEWRLDPEGAGPRWWPRSPLPRLGRGGVGWGHGLALRPVPWVRVRSPLLRLG